MATQPKQLTLAQRHLPQVALRPVPASPPSWRPQPVSCNVIFAGQRSYEAQREGYHPLTARHPGKMLPDLAAILLATYVLPMAERLGRPPVVLDGMAGVGTTLVEAIKLGINAVGVELETPWADVAQENCRLHEHLPGAGRGWVLHGDARDLPELMRQAVEAGLFSPWYGPLPDGKDTWGWKAYQRETGADAGMFSPPYGASRLSQMPEGQVFGEGNWPDDQVRRGYQVDGGLCSPPYGPTLDHHRGPDQQEGRRRRMAEAGYSLDPKVAGGESSAYNRSLGYDAGLVSPPYGPVLGEGDHGRGIEASRSGLVMDRNGAGAERIGAGYVDPSLEKRRQRILEAEGERTGAARSGFEKATPGASAAASRLGAGYVDAGLASPPYGPAQTGRGMALTGVRDGDTEHIGNCGGLPFDAAVTSPPYGEVRQDGGAHQFGESGAMTNYSGEDRVKRAGRKQNNLGNVPYGKLSDALAYLEHLKAGGPKYKTGSPDPYPPEALRWRNYLAQMAPVYLGYHQVIRPGGVLIVVVRNFRRARAEVDLVGDTVRLCEAAGFKLHATIPCLLSGVRMSDSGDPEVVPRVSPFKRVNANRRRREEGVPQLLEVYEMALVLKRP